MAALPPAPPSRRFLAWLYTGPLGHLWSVLADVCVLWARWGVASLRSRVAARRGRAERRR